MRLLTADPVTFLMGIMKFAEELNNHSASVFGEEDIENLPDRTGNQGYSKNVKLN